MILIMLNNSQLFLSALNNGVDGKLSTFAPFEYKAIFLSKIVPDDDNARYFPAKIIDDVLAKQFLSRKITKAKLVKICDAEGKVIVGRGVFINCLEFGTVDWRNVNGTIKSITALAQSIEVSELIQVPTVYPIDQGQFRILTGHRRFFALIYSQGQLAAVKMKVYEQVPLLKRIKQFQENASREDLSQFGKLQAFIAARGEIEALETAQKQLGHKKITVRQEVGLLGISMGAYDNYNVLTRYPQVMSAYNNGMTNSFVKTKKLILDIENQYREENEKTIFNITDKREIGRRIEVALEGKGHPKKERYYKTYTLKNVNSPETIKKLLYTNIMESDLDVDWETVDWDNMQGVERILDKVITFLKDS